MGERDRNAGLREDEVRLKLELRCAWIMPRGKTSGGSGATKRAVAPGPARGREEVTREPGIRWAIAVATVLHVVGVASLRDAAAGRGAGPQRPVAEAPVDLEVEIVSPAEVAPVRAPYPPPPAPGRVQIAAHDAERVRAPAPSVLRDRREAPPVADEGEPPPAEPGSPPDDAGEADEADPDAWSLPERDPAEPGSGYGLSLAGRIALAPAPAPAPTEAPKRAPLTPESVERGLRSAMREKDQQLGLGAPERQIVARAVREPLRAVPAPSGTHVAYEVTVDRTGLVGSVRRLRSSAGDESMWREADRAIAGSLVGKRLPVGVDAQRAGVRIVVAASILHVLPSGSVDGEWVGDCSPSYEDGDLHGSRALFPSESFFSNGGAMYGDRPSGTCTTYEDPNGKRHIEVRATTTSHFQAQSGHRPSLAPAPPCPSSPLVPRRDDCHERFENEPPPPGKPKPARLLPWIKKDKKPP
jgi:hypothetical protein